MNESKKTTKITDISFPTWLVLAICVITTLIFFRENIFGSGYLWDDVAEYIYPFTTFAARSTAQGILPFWNPYTFSGMPFLADFQTQYFYPIHTAMSLLLDAKGNLSPKAIEWAVWLHFILAQWTMFHFARFRGVSSMGSLISAIAFSFSGALAARTIHPMVVYHMAWFPLILLCFHKALFERSIKFSLFAGLILGLAMISGHPQTTAFVMIFTAGYGIWYVVDAITKKEIASTTTALSQTFGLAVLPFVLAFGLTAVQFLPAKELADLSERSAITYEKTADGSLQFKQLLTAVVPNIFGKSFPNREQPQYFLTKPDTPNTPVETHYYWDTAFYFGVIPLMLGLFGAAWHWKTPVGGITLIFSTIAFLYALGENGFLHPLLQTVPFVGSFRNPSRIMFYASFCFSLTAGMGFDALSRSKNQRSAVLSKFFTPNVMVGVIALFTALGMMNSILDIPDSAVPQIQKYGVAALIFCIIGFVGAHVLHRQWLRSEFVGALFIAASFIDLSMAYSGFSASKSNPAKEFQIDPEMKQAFAVQSPDAIFRVSMRNKHGMAMKRNQGALDGIMLYEGYNPILLSRRNPRSSSPKEVFDLLNIRYELVVDSTRGQLVFAERPTAFPRARMVYSAKFADDNNIESLMKAGNIDYKNEAILEIEPQYGLPNVSVDSVPHTVKCQSYANNNCEYYVETQKPGILCFSEIWYPAWKIEIDGKEAPLLRTNYSLRGVSVPAGRHSIRMYYSSERFQQGAAISGITLILILAGLFGTWIMNKKRSLHKR